MDLRIENLRKEFGERTAVEIPSLVIRSGEFFTFVGPSGCGKSTTLNLIAGLEEPTGGALTLGDRVLNDLPPHRRDVAFVFQSYALYPQRTVFGNIAFPLELAGVTRGEIRRRVQETAEMLGLTPLLEKRPRQLSGGERQRVALGRAIVRQPQLFLFDEPLSNLDAPLRAQMRKELKRLHRQLGTTFIYVTHDQEEALSLSGRIAVMQAGRIQQCGTPAEIYDRPANTFVAAFFGSPAINFVEGTVEHDAGGARLQLGSLGVALGEKTARAGGAAPRGRVTVGLRPEHIRISCEPLAGALPMRVALVEPHGGQCYVELEGEGIRLTAVLPAEAAPAVDDRVQADIAPERLHLFDAVSGQRL